MNSAFILILLVSGAAASNSAPVPSVSHVPFGSKTACEHAGHSLIEESKKRGLQPWQNIDVRYVCVPKF